MDEKTKKLIKERFDALPESIQEIILSSNYEETLLEIGKKYNLNVEKLGVLERETTMTMMGLTPTKDFETELTRELDVEKEKGSQIVKDINEKIFLKIRELLKLMNTPAGEEPSIDETGETKNTGVDWDVLNSAGIEIITKPDLTLPELKVGDKQEKTEIHPMLAQKLSDSVQAPAVKTDYSLKNLQPSSSQNGVVPQKPIDPYREIPE